MQSDKTSVEEVKRLKWRSATDSNRYESTANESTTNETGVDKMLQIEKYALFSVLVFSITVFVSVPQSVSTVKVRLDENSLL